jgi:hypothetical protein
MADMSLEVDAWPGAYFDAIRMLRAVQHISAFSIGTRQATSERGFLTDSTGSCGIHAKSAGVG